MPNITSIPSFVVEGGVKSTHYQRVIAKESIAQRKYMLERLEKKLNLPFKLKNMIDNIPVANLQIGDTIQFLDENAVRFERTRQIYCFAMVNSYRCLVSWSDFTWYRSYNSCDVPIPTCDVLEKLLPETGWVDFDFMYNHTFIVSAYCDVEEYLFNYDGTPKYVCKIIDGKEVWEKDRVWFKKPMYVVK